MDAAIPPFEPQSSSYGESCSATSSVKKKRKQRSTDTIEEVREYSKSARLDQSDGGSSSWKNLQLVLSLQDKNTDLQKKVYLAYDYVKSSSREDTDDISWRQQVLDTSRTIIFLNNWIQSVLFSSEKKMRLEEEKPQSETSGSFLDLRCWKIFQFCLEESKKLHVSLTCSRDFLRVIHSIVTNASSFVNMSISCVGNLSSERLQFYDVVLDCIRMVFSAHSGVANENLELWILLMDKVLELALKTVTGQLDSSKLGNFMLQLSCYLFEPFAMFLRVHPTRKSGFHNFIDKLLEPLLHMLHVLHSNSCGSNNEWITNLPKLVEEVLAQGLFHPTHIDGFLGLQSTARYKASSDATVKEEKLVNKSYHRHLFDKVEKMIAKTNESALTGLGELLHLFVGCVTKHKGALVTGGDPGRSESSSTCQTPINPNQSGATTSKMNPMYQSMNAELRKSIFDFCVQLLEYLLADLSKYLQPEGEAVSELYNITSALKSINNLLASIISDKLYLRTEDTSEGASRNFLRAIYDMLMSLSAKFETSFYGSDEKSNREILVSVRTEIIVAVHHLCNIEYEVVGDDLESLWSMVISSAACCYNSMDVLGRSLLSSAILSLSCRLIDLYSELRQVDASVFALCRAVRQSSLNMRDCEAYSPSSFCSSYSNSSSILFRSSEFRLSLSNAIKAIPEGQASACLRQLSSDIKESLEWVKFGHQLRAELLGKMLSEVYSIILDSVTVTSGNSYLVGVSLTNLIEILHPSLIGLVSKQPDSSKDFSVLVDGRTLSKRTGSNNLTMGWILVLLFRLVLCCRCLFRQAISLMPPDASKKMSGVMGDSLTVQSGRDWLEMTGSPDKGFFSWILPSGTLLNVIHSVSDICIKDSVVLCAPLVYVLNAMALQRLADLNRLIKSSEYMLQWTQSLGQNKLKDDTDSSYDKRIRKWSKYVAKLRKEAAGLTESMIESISSIATDQKSSSLVDGEIESLLIHGLHNNGVLNFALGSLDEKSLPSILWWIMCKNVDIWSSHATKKHAKNFLTLIIDASLSSVNNNDGHFKKQIMSKTGHLNKVTTQHIALEFLSNTISYEQRFVRRYMASRFCRLLQKSVHSMFTNSGVNLSESPDWNVALSAVENVPSLETLPWTKRDVVPAESCNEQPNVSFDRCQYLLALLMQMPEEFLRLKSSSLYITYILNLERLLVGSLLGWHTAKCSQNPIQVFQLFVTCRKVLQILAASSSKENANGSQSAVLCSFPLLWLLKSLSAATGVQHAISKDIVFEDKVAIFSLLDHTSNVLLKVSRDQFESAFNSIISVRKLHGKRKSFDPSSEETELSACNLQLNPPKNLDACQSVLNLAKALEDGLENSLACFREVSLDKRLERLARFQDLSKLSSIIACSQGLFWGLASTLGDTNSDNSNLRTKSSSYNSELMTRIKSCVDTCVDFTTYFLKALFLEDDPTLNMSENGSDRFGARESSSGKYDDSRDGSDEDCPTGKLVPSDIKGDQIKRDPKRKSSLSLPDLEAFLTKVQHPKLYLKKSLLMQVFKGENAEAAFFLRQLFIACSAILRLNLQIEITSSSWGLFVIVVNISEFLLLEFSRSNMPHQFAFFCLDGVVNFLEELGSYFPHFDSSLSRDFYGKLIGLHLRAIGKCICLQGKEAKLASQETGSHSKLADDVQSCLPHVTSRLCDLKERLRISFRKYVGKSSELHLRSAIQAIERALAGVQEGSMTTYEIVCGSSSGGAVSSVVAAGIDALDLIIESVTGPRRLNMIKKHIQNLVACLLNIILHLQGPSIFTGCLDPVKAYERPDSGAVILMCIEILTKISGKSSLFQIDSSHVAHSLRTPGALFQYFLRLQISEASVHAAVDRKISVELYASCCRMLCTALKHHKSETHQCIALLEDSVSALLHCLETVNTDRVAGRESVAWEVQEAVICASSLRRVYEEVRQQKDVFGQCSFQFLSRYIWVFCGLGPSRNGIIREVDEALKPGVHALIDSCSADDLQLLHTVFGEGACRSTLAALQHDYKVNFQYGGKV